MRLLHAMGWETANIHLGTGKPKTLLADLAKRPQGWLLKAARAMEKAVLEDFKDYKMAEGEKPEVRSKKQE